jgi:Holliday junction DNA helicase RuvA
MISRVRGVLLRREMELAEVMTAGGVGYELEIPLSVYERLPREGAEVELRTHYLVRQDGVALYGFLEAGERALFARLITASGIGPRLALAMLSTLSAERLVRAIRERDIPALRQVPGLGTKKAERLALELGDKLDDLAFAAAEPRPEGRAAEEAVRALVALGYSPTQAAAAVRQALDERAALEGAELIKAALAKAAE